MRKSFARWWSMAMHEQHRSRFFVDELQTCSELTCLAVYPSACEVAVARRCGAPVVSGHVPPAVAPWSGGRAGEPRRTLLPLAAP